MFTGWTCFFNRRRIMNRFLKLLPYLIVNVIAFYLFPLFMQNTGTAIIFLLVGIPLVCFISAFIYGVKNNFSWSYPVIVALLFTPSIFIFYNHTAWVYIVGYAIIAFIGSLVGKLLYNKKQQKLNEML